MTSDLKNEYGFPVEPKPQPRVTLFGLLVFIACLAAGTIATVHSGRQTPLNLAGAAGVCLLLALREEPKEGHHDDRD